MTDTKFLSHFFLFKGPKSESVLLLHFLFIHV